MSTFWRIVALLGCVLQVAHAIPAEFTIYSNINQTGQSIHLTETQRNLASAVNLIGGMRSRCLVGAWIYVNDQGTLLYPSESDSRQCQSPLSEMYKNVTALYRVGPADTSTVAIAFHNGNTTSIIEKIADAFIDVNPSNIKNTYVCVSGSSEWTLFAKQNFEGASKCLSFPKQVGCSLANSPTIGLPTIGSLIKGCNHSTATISSLKMSVSD